MARWLVLALCYGLIGLALFVAAREARLVWRGGCARCSGLCEKSGCVVKKKH